MQAINSGGFTPLDVSAERVVSAGARAQLSVVNPSDFALKIEDGAIVDLVMLHGGSDNASLTIRLGRGAKVNVTDIYTGTAAVALHIVHGQESQSKVVAVSLGLSTINFDVQLCGPGAFSELYTLQMGSQKDKNSLMINMRHMSPDCSSRSLSKCVASGESSLRFEGLVYVAHDAQRTAAEQNCRSIELSDSAHIVARPQLEIYADDVKCSHGATMGQVDADAIFYLRQRGLSQAQARRVQMEGFVADVVRRCEIESICEPLIEVVAQKLESM
ncbi:MAG: SufD family Fe-S cluster assembly protein [Rikenellaceae bacterium]